MSGAVARARLILIVLSILSFASLGRATTLSVASDTFVNLTYPAQHNGKNEFVSVRGGLPGSVMRGYVRFDTSLLLPGADIQKAVVRLWVDAALRAGRMNANVVLDPWDENSLTGSSEPVSGGGVTFEIGASDQGHYVLVDVTDFVRDWASGALANNGLVISGYGGDKVWARFDSKENSTTSHAPELEVVLGSPAGPPTDLSDILTRVAALEVRVAALEGLPVIANLAANPNPVPSIAPSDVSFELIDPAGGPLTWSATVAEPPEYSGGSINPSSGGPVPSGTSVHAVYQTPGGLAVGTVTVTAKNSGGRSVSSAVTIPTCQPSGTVSYNSTGGPWPTIPAGSTFTFDVSVVDCPGVSVTVAGNLQGDGGGTLTFSPANRVVVGQGHVYVTFNSVNPTNATVTLSGTDSLGTQNPFLQQTVVVQ